MKNGLIAFCVVLVFLVLLGYLGSESPTSSKLIKSQILAQNIQTAIMAYKAEYGVTPYASDNAQFVKALTGDNQRKIEFISLKPRQLNPNGELLDGWGTPFGIAVDTNSVIHVRSAGPDKIFGTTDDISN